MKIEKEFKQALASLPEQEKDKLIVRLLKKDEKLMRRLYFELIDTRSVEELRNDILEKIEKTYSKLTEFNFTPADFLYYTRFISANIADHVFTTKDKFGEPYLTLRLLVSATDFISKEMPKTKFYNDYKIYQYILDKVFNIMKQVRKLDPDYLLEFRDLFKSLKENVAENHNLLERFTKHGMDIDWFDGPFIPNDIEEIHKASKMFK